MATKPLPPYPYGPQPPANDPHGPNQQSKVPKTAPPLWARGAALKLLRGRGNPWSLGAQFLIEETWDWWNQPIIQPERWSPREGGWQYVCQYSGCFTGHKPLIGIFWSQYPNVPNTPACLQQCNINAGIPKPYDTPLPTNAIRIGEYAGMFGNRVTSVHSWFRSYSPGDFVQPWRPIRARPGLLPHPFPEPGAPWRAQPGTSPVPNVFPEAVPPGAPLPLPSPRPFGPNPKPQPGIDPAYQPQTWPGRARPSPAARPWRPSPGVVVVPPPAPGEGPAIIIQPGPVAGPKPGPGAKPSPKPGPRPGRGLGGSSPSKIGRHRGGQPKKGDKEKKFKGSGAAKAAQKLFGAATEGIDMLDAAWAALSPNGGWQTKIPGQKTLPQQKAKDIYNAFSDPNFDKGGWLIDFGKNAAVAQATDAAIGAAAGPLKKASAKDKPHGGLPFGYGFGPAI